MEHDTTLTLTPSIPKAWTGYAITYHYKSATYEITVENPHSVNREVEQVELDGQRLAEKQVPLVDDVRVHRVRVVLGLREAKASRDQADSASVAVAEALRT